MHRNLPWPSCFLCETTDLVEYLVLKAWFDDPYKNRKTGETLRAELCRECVRENLAPWVRFSVAKPEPPRSPYIPPLTFDELRKQASAIKEIICDGCNQSCTDQYMQLASGTTRLAQYSWLTIGRQQQIHEHIWKAQLCPDCVEHRLQQQIAFFQAHHSVSPKKTRKKTA